MAIKINNKAILAVLKSGILILIINVAFPVAADIQYEITDIGNSPDGGVSSKAQVINDLSQVAAFSNTTNLLDNNVRYGFIWQNNQQPISMGQIGAGVISGFANGSIVGMNNSGEVTGVYQTNSTQYGYLWQNGSQINLGAIDPKAVSNTGQIIGNYTDNITHQTYAVVWQNGVNIPINAPANSVVYSANSQGLALLQAGSQYYFSQINPVTGLATTSQVSQTNLAGISPSALLASGQVLGNLYSSSSATPVIWFNGSITHLLTLPGIQGQFGNPAYAANNVGQIVGFADIISGDSENLHALLWGSNGNPLDLNSISNAQSLGLSLEQAYSINNLGQIVGVANTGSGQTGFLATPTGTLSWSAASGAWDNSANWGAQLGFTPNALFPVLIQPNADAIVVGPVADTTVKQLDLGGGSGTVTLDLNSGSLSSINQLTVHDNGVLNLSAGSLTASSILNQGVINLSGAGIRSISGDISNQGVFKATDTTVQYSGVFTNDGAYLSDPATNHFNNLTVGANGYLSGGAGDQFIVTGNFLNASAQNNLWNTSNAGLEFSGPNSTVHIMQLAGVDKGVTPLGAANNFAWGSVTLDNGNLLSLINARNTPNAALYTSKLILPGGVAELQSISSNFNIYFDPSQSANQYLLGAGNTFGSGNGQLLPWSYMPFSSATLSEPGLTSNQQSFATALNQACASPGGVLLSRCLQLEGLNPAQQKIAIASLTPDQVPGQMAGPIKFSATRLDAPFSRLASLRNGSGNSPLSFNFNGVQMKTGAKRRQVLGGAAGDEDAPFGDSALGAFIQARFNFADQQNSNWDRGFSSQGRAVTVGADYRFSEAFVAGLALNYTNWSTEYAQFAGRMNSDTILGAIYGSYYLPNDFYLDWVANYGGSDYQFSRQFGFGGFSSQTQAKPSGNQYSFALSSGKEFNWQQWLVRPYLRLEYLNMQIDAYKEQGGGGFDMTTGSQGNDSFVSDLGAQISYAASLSWGVITPAVYAEWEHQYLNNNRAIQMRLSQAAPGLGNFSIQTGSPDRNYLNLGGSLSAALPNNGAGFVRYETRLGQSYITDHVLEVGVRMSF
jgi:uncharacterized protein with beta-barrel porin domain